MSRILDFQGGYKWAAKLCMGRYQEDRLKGGSRHCTTNPYEFGPCDACCDEVVVLMEEIRAEQRS